MEKYRFSPGTAVYYSVNHIIVDKPNWVTYHNIHQSYTTGTSELYMGNTEEYMNYLYSKLDEYKVLYELPSNIEELFKESYMYLDIISTSSANGILVQRGIEYATDKNEEMSVKNIPHSKQLFQQFTTCIFIYIPILHSFFLFLLPFSSSFFLFLHFFLHFSSIFHPHFLNSLQVWYLWYFHSQQCNRWKSIHLFH